MQRHVVLLDVVEALEDVDLAIGAVTIANCPTETKKGREYASYSFPEGTNLQSWPSTTLTSRHMCKVSNQEPVQELIIALKPDALASNRGIGYDGDIINAHVDLIVNDLRHTKRSGLGQRNVFDKAMGWVWQLCNIIRASS